MLLREIILEVFKLYALNVEKIIDIWKHYDLSNIKFLHLLDARHWAWLQ